MIGRLLLHLVISIAIVWRDGCQLAIIVLFSSLALFVLLRLCFLRLVVLLDLALLDYHFSFLPKASLALRRASLLALINSKHLAMV